MQSNRLLLVTPQEASAEPSSGRIDIRPAADDSWSALLDEQNGFTHVALCADVAGPIASDMLLSTVDADPGTILVLPLAGYEWIAEIASDRRLLTRVPFVRSGTLVVAPAAMLRDPKLTGDARPSHVGVSLPAVLPSVPFRVVVTERPVAQPLRPFTLPLLVPAAPRVDFDQMADIDEASVDSATVRSPQYRALMAGLAQVTDHLDASHKHAQSIEGHPDGDYWHAIMHRREPDYSNSRYWFRRLGPHPVFARLASHAGTILSESPDLKREWSSRLQVGAGWNPMAFIDMCERAARDEQSPLAIAARRIQWTEMLLLLEHTSAQLA